MVLGMLIITAIPTTIGVTQALRFKDKQQADDEPVRFTLVTICAECEELDRKIVVLHKGRLYLKTTPQTSTYHPFSGYFLPYPHPPKPQGLVSTISDDPPMLNWIFVDSKTREVRHGTGSESRPHQTESWSFEEEDGRLRFGGDGDGWVAVEEDLESEGEEEGGEKEGEKEEVEGGDGGVKEMGNGQQDEGKVIEKGKEKEKAEKGQRWALYHDNEDGDLDLEGKNWYSLEVLRVPLEEESG